jgi:hypothetical protein
MSTDRRATPASPRTDPSSHALRCLGFVFIAAAVSPGARAFAQEPIVLARPDVRLSEPFSLLRGARELPDGRLLVTDWIEQRLAVVDFARDAAQDRGRVGAGPGEFRLPAALLPFRADSTLLVDVGNARLTVLDAEGRPGRSFQPRHDAARWPGGADASGRIYFTIPAWQVERPLANDTVELAVYDPATHEVRTVARVHGSRQPSSNYAPTPRVPFVVFAAQDTWTVGGDGRVAIVRDDGYRVQWLRDGAVVAGPAYAGTPRPVRPADRSEFVRQFLASSPLAGKGEDGGMGATPAELQSRAQIELVVRGSEFAETLPDFRAGDTRSDAAGRLWVGVFTAADAPRRYDVFDAQGRRRATVQLGRDRHLLAVGRAHLYVAHTDQDGLQTIERYDVPAVLTQTVR